MDSLSPQSVLLGASGLALFGAIRLFQIWYTPFPAKAPQKLPNLSFLLGCPDIITAPWEVFKRGLAISTTRNFSFKFGAFHAVALGADSAREFFFTHPAMGFETGYDTIFGQTGRPPPKVFENGETHFNRRLRELQKNDWLAQGLPTLISDINARLGELGLSGVTNPFYSIHTIVIQLTSRFLGCREIAEDPALRSKVQGLIEDFDSTISTTSVIFKKVPFFWDNIRKTWTGIKFYNMVNGIVSERKKTGRTENDPLQRLIDEGDTLLDMVGFIFGGMFAGVVNTGNIASWTLVQLATSPEWLNRVRAEIVQVAAKYASVPTAPLREQLLDVPLVAWENEFPSLEMCVKETMRLRFQNPMLRRILSEESVVVPGGSNEVIPGDALVFFFTTLVHMNPEIFSEPEKWDPSRFAPERAEDKKAPHTFVGWGSGKHPCRGMRFAKLEMTIIFAFFVSRFDFEALDRDGKNVKGESLPLLYRNFKLRKEDFSLKYSVREQ